MSEDFVNTDIWVGGLVKGNEVERHFLVSCDHVVSEDEAVAIARVLWPELSFINVSTEEC